MCVCAGLCACRETSPASGRMINSIFFVFQMCCSITMCGEDRAEAVFSVARCCALPCHTARPLTAGVLGLRRERPATTPRRRAYRTLSLHSISISRRTANKTGVWHNIILYCEGWVANPLRCAEVSPRGFGSRIWEQSGSQHARGRAACTNPIGESRARRPGLLPSWNASVAVVDFVGVDVVVRVGAARRRARELDAVAELGA